MDGWKPDHTQGILDVLKRSSQIRSAMNQMRGEIKVQERLKIS